MTSVAFVSSFPELNKRLINFTTNINPASWAEVVRKIVACPDVINFELYRSSQNRSCWNLAVFTESCDESDDESLIRLFGPPFVEKFLSISDKTKMGPCCEDFIRIMHLPTGNEADECTDLDLFYMYETLTEVSNGHTNTLACKADYENGPKINLENVLLSTEAASQFNRLAKKHHLEGGSWLCLPRKKHDTTDEELQKTLRRLLEKLAMEFCIGRLQAPWISKVSFSKLKGVVKVSNDKTVYFDFVEKNAGKDLAREDENMFREDRQVREIYGRLYDMRLQANLRYKPEVFTACKLNTKSVATRLSLYNEIHHERKYNISKE